MTSKHTPGPWTTEKMDGHTAVAANTLIARVFSTAFKDLENEEANAKLISAAPDMRAALIEIHEMWGGDDGYLKEVDACEELGIESPVLVAWKNLLKAITKSGGM